MVFSSIPLYLDPHNWHQQQQNHQHEGGGSGNHQLSVLPPPPPPQMGGGGAGSIRPGSMADRARLVKLPQPEPGLKCPRCESTNTKFCYFNNYSLTQPRHFCKACRRYWTRGGALRSVPVGGGCRRNKRSSKNSSNSTTTSKSSQVTSTTPSSCSTEVIPTHFPQLPLMPSLENLGSTTQFGAANLGLNFGGIQPESDLGFIQLGSYNNNSSEKSSTILSDQWRNSQQAQHFPFLTSFEPAASTSFYQLFQSDQNVVHDVPSSNPLVGQMKMEDQNPLGLNLTKPLLGGGSENINQYWGNGGNAWTDFSGGAGLNSSSPASHLL